ncbi:DUF7009 family protein [Cellulophaga baltica]|uniref:Uncharacterized protein n=1 Tax=Cellulophaga baltica 18 TaxID=1348584 RepID=A0AAU8RJ95_9FLAO|nr:hypothetical protein [Cellulophaga baltica]AIZ40908.1 hypothetical protein M666_04625 [Cellulophaga baltica 18]
MKIRIKGNTLRYRLTKSDVETFCSTGFLSEKTAFATTQFSYELIAKEGISQLEADYTNNTITLYFPKADTKDWATNETVGFENIHTTSAGDAISILIEKDFICMDQALEDQANHYPNPKL